MRDTSANGRGCSQAAQCCLYLPWIFSQTSRCAAKFPCTSSGNDFIGHRLQLLLVRLELVSSLSSAHHILCKNFHLCLYYISYKIWSHHLNGLERKGLRDFSWKWQNSLSKIGLTVSQFYLDIRFPAPLLFLPMPVTQVRAGVDSPNKVQDAKYARLHHQDSAQASIFIISRSLQIK